MVHNAADISDRGLAYGHGLFETLRARAGRVALQALHRERFVADARRLGLPGAGVLFDQGLAAGLARAGSADTVIKLVLTAGSAGRGYASPPSLQPNLLVQATAYTPRPRHLYENGLVIGLCRQRLSDAGALAGIKHLARLEQVVAATQVAEHGWDEGLVLDQYQRPLELTAMNLFARFGDRLWTPSLARAGVAGVMRQWILAHWLPGQPLALCQRPRTLAELHHADEVFACNAVAGVLPVRKLAVWQWPVGEVTRGLQSTLENGLLRE